MRRLKVCQWNSARHWRIAPQMMILWFSRVLMILFIL
jgi:hypothetical protein